MTEPKEPHFFSLDKVYERGLDWYRSLYGGVKDEKMIGEGSNTYTMKEVYPKALPRILDYVDELKLIYCVRDPIPRIESYWLQKRSHDGEAIHYDFNIAVRKNRDHLVDSANYWQQISPYRDLFPDEKIHVVFFEDFKKSPQAVIQGCFEFLGVNSDLDLVEACQHLGGTTGKLVPKQGFSKMRTKFGSNAIYKSLVGLIPFGFRTELKKKFLFQPVQGRPEWEQQTKDWVISLLRDDSEKFLEFYGKPKDFWSVCR